MKLRFQAQQPSDKNRLWETYVQAMKLHIENIWGWDEKWQKNDFNKSLKRFETSLIVVNNKKIGYLQYKNNERSTFINMLIINPQNQQLRIGVKVLERLQQSTPNSCIELKCFRVNKRAYNFYRINGFKLIAMDPCFYRLSRNVFSM